MASFNELYERLYMNDSFDVFEEADDEPLGKTLLIEQDEGSDILTFREIERIDKTIDAGKVAAGVGMFSAIGIAALAVIGKNATPSIKKQISSLEKQIKKIKSLQDSGNLSPRQAKKEIRVIIRKIKSLEKQAKKKTVKESVYDDLRLEIYESCQYGDITEEERDILLDLL